MSLYALKAAFFNSSYITQPIGDKSHEILCKLESIQRKKLEGIHNAPAPLPLGVKNETCDNNSSNTTSNAEVFMNRNPIESSTSRVTPLEEEEEEEEEDAMMEEEIIASPISSWI